MVDVKTQTYTITSGERKFRSWGALAAFVTMLTVGSLLAWNIHEKQEQIQLAQARADRESLRAALIVESSPSAIVMCDDHGKIVLSNFATESLLGWKKEELVGQYSTILVPKDDRVKHLIGISRAAATMRGFDGHFLMMLSDTQFKALHKSGELIPIVVEIRVIKFMGEVQFIVTMRSDAEPLPIKQGTPVPLPEISDNVNIGRAMMQLQKDTAAASK